MPLADSPATIETLPIGKLLAFTTAGFLAIMTETMPAGLLPQISGGLDISAALAGQMLTLYALGSVVAAIPVIAATRSWNRRPLLLLAIGGLFVFNSITALSSTVAITLIARFVAGMAAGVIWGLLAGYARRLAPAHLQGRALAVTGIGQPIALAAGVPLGAWLGMMLDWRAVFWIMSAVALLLAVWVRLGIPDHPGQPAAQRLPIARVAALPGIASILLVLFAWITGHNILYTYIAPFLTMAAPDLRLDMVLLLFGVSAVIGIWATGLLVDRHLRPLTLLSLAGFAGSALLLSVVTQSPMLVLAGIVTWGLTFGGAPTLLQTALADAAGDNADVAQSILVTVFNLAIAVGSVLGGIVVGQGHANLLPYAMLTCGAAALIAALMKLPQCVAASVR
ncbi:MFS transporter [Sphingomonas sp. CFBP 13720]|uniref:MFS transporter n=1 Tax=Sphingomonas sp. CFBP 13720 TaxID=2775302 RepID=UPI00177ECAFE|nr:MFS transporter [Sphingomonas sp. CFBP 13720]MBD8678910.1 MFS transporter [Sphingomonas sp. CFBP 13720]